jgi:hypothetical protein
MFIEPVFGKKFYGREEILATLHKRVNAIKSGYRQNMALAGPMLAGKSSILRHFLKSLRDDEVIPLYVDMSATDFETFSARFMATLLYQYLSLKGDKAEGTLESLIKNCEKDLPMTVNEVREILRYLGMKKHEEAYESLLDLTSTFRSECGKNCVVILDEFHNLSNFHLKRPFQVFGKFIMVQKNTMYILSSSQKTLLKDILSKKLSLLFGNFELIEVDGFDNQTARSFIADKANKLSIPDEIAGYVIQITRGNPFYLENIMKRFVSVAAAKGAAVADREVLVHALAELLYESEGILNQYFTNNINFFLEKKTRKNFIPVLLSLARGNNKVKKIQEDLASNTKDIGARLTKLQYMDLVFKSGVFYKVEDKLFEYWLRNVYDLKTGSMADDMDIKYLEFKNLVEKDISAYAEFFGKSFTEVITDLFRSFRNEKVHFNMNDKKLPTFDSVHSKQISSKVSSVEGASCGAVWLCHIKQDDLVEESDIAGLAKLGKNEKGMKIARKIIIPLKGIEHNSFLLAKEKNIWVWNVERLNRILRLYGKFELVL